MCLYIYMIKFEIREIRKLASQCWMSPLQSSSSPQAPMMMKLPLTTLKLQQKLRQRRWLRNVPSHDLLPKWQWYGMGTRSSGQDVLRYDDIINFWKIYFKKNLSSFQILNICTFLTEPNCVPSKGWYQCIAPRCLGLVIHNDPDINGRYRRCPL